MTSAKGLMQQNLPLADSRTAAEIILNRSLRRQARVVRSDRATLWLIAGHKISASCGLVSIVLTKATISQRTRKRLENDQSNDRDNDYHNDHFWIFETLACDYKCSGDVALAGANSHDAPGVDIRSAKQLTKSRPQVR